jgi:hypothetical protein
MVMGLRCGTRFLEKLRIAVHNGAELIQENTPLPETWGPNGIFRAFPGISKSSPTSQPHNHLTTRLRKSDGSDRRR